MSDGRILIVDDEESMCQFLAIMLRKEGFTVHAVTSGVEALREMKKNPYDIVMTDIQMPRMDGIQVLSGVKAIDPSVPVIIMTAYASQKTAIEAVNKGAFHYLNKHAKNDEIKMVVRNALEVKKVKSENVQLKRALSTNARKVDPSDRKERRTPKGTPLGGQDCHRREQRPDLRGKWYGQGTHSPFDPRKESPRQRPLHHHQLRGPSREPSRERAVRSRQGLFHERDPRQGGHVQGGLRRDFLPG